MTRANKPAFRNLRQQTHALKRAVLSEFTRFVYNRDRLWYAKWNTQERLLEEAVATYVAEANERQQSVTKKKEAEEEAKRKRLERRATKLKKKLEQGGGGGGRRRSVVVDGKLLEEQSESDSEEEQETIFEKLGATLESAIPLPKSYHQLGFYHDLMKYNQSQAFDRAKWVLWQAKREHERDLERRRDDLLEEERNVRFTKVCPLLHQHVRTNIHCKACNRRVVRTLEMWLTNITEPQTGLESLFALDYILAYCEQQLELNLIARLELEKEISAIELILFGTCAEYLQTKYALHVGHFLCKKREKCVRGSIENYNDMRFEMMCKDVRDGNIGTEELYVKFAEIGEKLESYLHFHAALRRRRLRSATKRIIFAWRERKRMKEINAKMAADSEHAEERQRVDTIVSEKEVFAASLKRKGLEEMKEEMKKRLEKHAQDNTFVCPRRECKERVFTSRDLFRLHEKLHLNEDLKVLKEKEERKKKADVRLAKEKVFMVELAEKRKKKREEMGLSPDDESSTMKSGENSQTLHSVLNLVKEEEIRVMEGKERTASVEEPEEEEVKEGGGGGGGEGGKDGGGVDDGSLTFSYDGGEDSAQNFDQMDVEEFFKITSPGSFSRHIQHFEERPLSPTVPKLFFNRPQAASAAAAAAAAEQNFKAAFDQTLDDEASLELSAISSLPSSLGNSPRVMQSTDFMEEASRVAAMMMLEKGTMGSQGGVGKGNIMSLEEMLQEETRRLELAEEEERRRQDKQGPATVSSRDGSNSGFGGMSSRAGGRGTVNDDQSVEAYSLASSLTDDFYSDSDFLSARSSTVTGVDLDDAIQELVGANQQVHDNFSSPSLTLVSTLVMPAEDLPQEIYLNKSLIRIGRSDKCDVVMRPMINFHMIAKVHMLVYTTWNDDGSIEVFVRDNKTKYGVYMLNNDGVKKCPSLTTLVEKGFHLKHGDKLCVCRDFGEEERPFEMVYEVKMPAGRARVKKGSVNVFDGVKPHLREAPKLIESSSMWWEEGGNGGGDMKGEQLGGGGGSGGNSGGGRSVKSRIERLRRIANGEQVPPARRDKGSRGGGGGGGSNMSLPDLKMRMRNNMGGTVGGGGRLFLHAGEGSEEENEESSRGGGGGGGDGGWDDATLDSSLGLGSIDESFTSSAWGSNAEGGEGGSISSSTFGSAGGGGGGGGSVRSARSVPTAKTKFLLTKGGEDAEQKIKKKREIQKKYAGGVSKRKDLLEIKRTLRVVDGKVVVGVG